MSIRNIKINNFPVIVITDSHTNIENIKELKNLYSGNRFISLGDFTSVKKLYGSDNSESVDYFIDNKIDSLLGNHDKFIYNVKTGKEKFSSLVPFAYGVKRSHTNYISKLPVGIRLELPNGENCLCFHNHPNQLGGEISDVYSTKNFVKNYMVDKNTTNVLTGHKHFNCSYTFNGIKCKLNRVGALKNGDYGILDEDGFKFKNLLPENLQYSDL